jgi:AraC-like DNA-binding protein
MPDAYVQQALTPPPARAGLIRVVAETVSQNRGGRSYGEHRHSDHELILVLAPGYRWTIAGTVQPVAVGDALLVLPGDLHADCGTATAAWTSMRFRLWLVAPRRHEIPLLRPEAIPTARRLPGLAPELAPLLSGIATLASRPDAGAALAAEALAAAVVWRLAGGVPMTVLHPRLAEVLAARDLASRIANCVAESSFAKLSVAELARHLGMSPSHLAHACTRDCGHGPAALMLAVRLAEARRLLQAGAAVGEAAQATGFSEPAHFTRAYRRAHGCTPSADAGSGHG